MVNYTFTQKPIQLEMKEKDGDIKIRYIKQKRKGFLTTNQILIRIYNDNRLPKVPKWQRLCCEKGGTHTQF